MGEVAPVPTRHPECRRNGETRAEISSSKIGWGGRRANSGGARPNSGGPRENSGGAREGAGRKRRKRTFPPPPRDPAGCWLCGEVRGGREDIAAAQFRRLGFEAYVPIGEMPRADGDRTQPREVGPLFPGYVFLRFGETTLSSLGNELAAMLDVPELLGIIRHGNGEPWPLLPGDVERLLARTHDGVIPLPERPAHEFAVGDMVAVMDGPFTGFPGVVAEAGARWLMVDVAMFGRSTPVPLLPESVELVVGRMGGETADDRAEAAAVGTDEGQAGSESGRAVLSVGGVAGVDGGDHQAARPTMRGRCA